MNITKKNVDALNVVITVDVATEDYQTKVTEVLHNYRKKADIPGFRKGYVPMGMVKKQYGKSVMIDEISKLLQESVDVFLSEEKLDILGGPLLIIEDDFSWDTETFSFGFELGLTPKFTIDLSSVKKDIIQYNVIADEIFIDKITEKLQYRYGEIIYLDKATKTSEITVNFSFNGEIELHGKETIFLKNVSEKNLNKFVGAEIYEVIEFEIKELSDDDELVRFLEMYDGDVSEPKVTFAIEKIGEIELVELNQEFFDKIFPERIVNSVTELRSIIKEDFEKMFKIEADRQLLSDITEYLVENTKFDLPAEFLQKFLLTAGENPISKEEAADEYSKSEKYLRHQLIEGKIFQDNYITIDYQEFIYYIKEFVKIKMEGSGNKNPEEKELNNIIALILEDEDEVENFRQQLIDKKMIAFYKDNISFKTREISYSDFVSKKS